jgi:hypothetical protein
MSPIWKHPTKQMNIVLIAIITFCGKRSLRRVSLPRDWDLRIYGRMAGITPLKVLSDCRIVRDDRLQGGGIQSKLEVLVDSSGRLG